jgi:hypothetical protein
VISLPRRISLVGCLQESAATAVPSWLRSSRRILSSFFSAFILASLSGQSLSAQALFTDVTSTTVGLPRHGGGIVLDIDNDGVDELVVGTSSGFRLLRREGAFNYSDITAPAGLADLSSLSLAADLDGDGYCDLLEVKAAASEASFYRNRGDGSFAKVGIAAAEVQALSGAQDHIRAVDIDSDGDLDLVFGRAVGSSGSIVAVLNQSRNASGLTQPFSGVTTLALTAWKNNKAEVTDANNDGKPDLLSIRTSGDWPNGTHPDFPGTLFLNSGTSPADYLNPNSTKTLAGFTQRDNCGISAANVMSPLASWDVDNDGDLDLINGSSDWPWTSRPHIYINDGAGNYTQKDSPVYQSSSYYHHGISLFDADLDNDMDAVWTSLHNFADIYPRMWRNDGNMTFSDATAAWGITARIPGSGNLGMGGYHADLDGDGDLDFVVDMSNGWGSEQIYRIYRNEAVEQGANWLGVKLVSSESAPNGIGARVEVTANGKTLTQYMADVTGGVRNLSALRFGLGTSTNATSLKVYWPSGTVTDLQNVQGNRIIEVTESPIAERVIYVSTDGDDLAGTGNASAPFATIQKGVDMALDGDVVLVAPGTYSGTGNRDINLRGKLITLRATSGPLTTVVDLGLGQAIIAHSTETLATTVDGFTFQNGYVESGEDWRGDGIVSILGQAAITLRNCIFRNNETKATYVTTTTGIVVKRDIGILTPLVENCLFYDNTIGGGGWVWFGAGGQAVVIGGCGGAGAGNVAVVVNCTIANNSLYSSVSSWGIADAGIRNPIAAHTVKNTISWGNSGVGWPSGYPANFQTGAQTYVFGSGGSANYSVSQNGFILDLGVTETGTLNSDPLFKNAASGDFSLLPGSPAIDAGDPSGLDPDGSRSDIGFSLSRAVFASDTDGDGVNDYRESYDGTNPDDPESFDSLSCGLVAHFDGESLDDQAGVHGLVLATKGGATVGAGKKEKAFVLDGVDDGFLLPDVDALKLKSFSIGAWVKWNGTEDSPQMIIFRGGYDSGNDPFTMGIGNQYTGNVGYVGTQINLGVEPSNTLLFEPTNPVAGRWAHLFATYDFATKSHKLYLDGLLVAEGICGGPMVADLPSWAQPGWGIGNHSGNVYNYAFGGAIDETRFYDRALSAEEVAQLHSKDASRRVYVDADAALGGDGTSWQKAFKYLQDAIQQTAAGRGDEIWIANGTYFPDEGGSVIKGDRAASFRFPEGIRVYGSFEGSESNVEERNSAGSRTILSGVISEDVNLRSQNVCTITDEASFDGVDITGGNANSGTVYDKVNGAIMPKRTTGNTPTILLRDCSFYDNRASQANGVTGEVVLTAIDCRFIKNSAGWGSGVGGGDPLWTLINCVFAGNSAGHGGVGYWGNRIAINCLFVGNAAGGHGAVFGGAGSAQFINCTFAENSGSPVFGGSYYTLHVYAANSIFWDENSFTTLGNLRPTHFSNIIGDTQINPSGSRAPNVLLGGAASLALPNTEGIAPINDYGDSNLLIDADPMFVNSGDSTGPDGKFGTSDDGLRLQETSVAIDKGLQSILPPDSQDLDGDGNTEELLPVDLAGLGRTVGASPDLGAYEQGGGLDSDGDGLSDDWERGVGRYQVVEGSFTWEQAKAAAELRGGHLATITSESEKGVVHELVSGLPVWASSHTWLGGLKDNAGNWGWVTGETWKTAEIGFNPPWYPGEPNNEGGNQSTLVIDARDLGQWDDYDGSWTAYYYVLEFGYPTDPLKADTDGDGFDDKVESDNRSDPNDTTSTPTLTDHDQDGVVYFREVADGTNPLDEASFNPLSKGLLAYYPFDNGLVDESGYSKHLDQTGNYELVEDLTQGSGQALRRPSNVNSGVWSSSYSGISGNSPRTISFWFYSDGPQPWPSGYAVSLAKNNVCIDAGKGYIFIDNYYKNVGTPPLPNLHQKVHHFVWTYQNNLGDSRFYIDGQSVPLVFDDGTPETTLEGEPDYQIFLGGITDRGFQGKLDDVRLYDRALTAAEVGSLYQAETGNLDSDGDGLTDAWERGYGRYQIIEGSFTWEQAKADAEARGGHLVTITSQAELDFVGWRS